MEKKIKGIKEKAEEVFPGHCNAYTYESNMKKRIGFVLGANYVLEQIEKECRSIAVLCNTHSKHPVDKEYKVDSLARLDEMEYILRFIEQLKR